MDGRLRRESMVEDWSREDGMLCVVSRRNRRCVRLTDSVSIVQYVGDEQDYNTANGDIPSESEEEGAELNGTRNTEIISATNDAISPSSLLLHAPLLGTSPELLSNASDRVERNNRDGSSVDANIIVSGVEFESPSDISEYEEEDDVNATSSTCDERLARLRGGEDKFVHLRYRVPITSPATMGILDSINSPSAQALRAEAQSSAQTQRSPPDDTQRFAIAPTSSSFLLPAVMEDAENLLEGDFIRTGIETLNRLHSPAFESISPIESTASSFPYSKFITPASQSKYNGSSDNLIAALASSESTSTIRTLSRSLSLPAVYSLGVGTLNRSFTLLGVQKTILEPRRRLSSKADRSNNSTAILEEWVLRGDASSTFQGDDDSSVKFYVDVSHHLLGAMAISLTLSTSLRPVWTRMER